jgi:DNA anti-recombination protein RmuC
VGAISAVATAAVVTGLTARDNRADIVDLRQDTDRLNSRIETGFSTCAERYAGVQALIHALESRLTVSETNISAHANEKGIWIDVIKDTARKVDELRNNPNRRPDPFTGTDGRLLEKRLNDSIKDVDKRLSALERYLDKDVIIMQQLMDDVKTLKAFHNGNHK